MSQLLHWFVPQRFWPYLYLKHFVDKAVHGRVISGPFSGLRYGDQAVCSSLYPKLLGSYEKELHQIIEQITRTDVRTLIDIGAAEGYYACGFARLLPQLKVIAYEASLQGRYLLNKNLALNNLSKRVDVRGCCNAEELGRVLAGIELPTLIICDTEGCEYELMLPGLITALRYCYLLVEMHEFMLPGITDCLCQRFAATHKIINIHFRSRTIADFPDIPQDLYARCLSGRHRLAFLDEQRPTGMNWLWMTPLNSDQ